MSPPDEPAWPLVVSWSAEAANPHVLGAGGAGYPGLRDLNGPDAIEPIDGALVVAVDLMGGGFAINGGGLPCREPGEVCFLGADDLAWLACGFGHSAFVQWALDGPVTICTARRCRYASCGARRSPPPARSAGAHDRARAASTISTKHAVTASYLIAS